MKHQIFISSYRKDFPWLLHNLASQKKFCVGFLPPVICVDAIEESECRDVLRQSFPEAIIATYSGPPGRDGFMRAQIGMMMCDLLCPEADFVHLLGSDCFVHREYTPNMLFAENGKPVMFYNAYTSLPAGPQAWKRGTERVLGFGVENEFMRRLPLVYPRALYAKMREHVERIHRMPFADYIYHGNFGNRDTSESNILGAYAWAREHEMYEWVCLDGSGGYERANEKYPSPTIQFWSHAGLDHPCDGGFKYLGGNTLGKTPRRVIDEVMGRHPLT